MNVERFAGGAIGEPGKRVFMLEVVAGGEAVGYVIEKFQVQALAMEVQSLLRERGLIGVGLAIEPGEVHAETPVAFRVGGLEMGIAEDSDMLSLAIISTDEDDDRVEYELSLAQLDAFAREALAVVASGRPACPRCGLAMDPDGHNCPRTNGDLRKHRP